MPDWHVPGLSEFDCMFGLSSWVVLRDHGSFCSNRSVRCRNILCSFSDCVFKLPDNDISGLNRLHSLYCMYSRVVLCDGGSFCSNGSMRCRDILSCFSDCVLKLSHCNISSLNGY